MRNNFKANRNVPSLPRVKSCTVSEAKGTPTNIFLSIVLGSICFGVVIAAESRAIAQDSVGISQPTTLRVQDTQGWWPTKSTAAKEEFVGNAACIRCHVDKSGTYSKSAMAHAAVSAENSEIAQTHDALRLQVGPFNYELQSIQGKNILKVSDAKASVSLPLSWSFGVGHMGQTYLYEQNGNYSFRI